MSNENSNEKKFDAKKFKENMDKAFKQFEEFEKFIPFLDENIDLIDKVISPIYETCEKAKKIFDKVFFIMTVISQGTMIIPFLKEISKKKGEDLDFTI